MPRVDTATRNRELCRFARNGWSRQELAEHFRLTRERVRQILKQQVREDGVYKLHKCDQLPEHWVIADPTGKFWIVPSVANGWEKRTPYFGLKQALTKLEPIFALGLGIPPS